MTADERKNAHEFRKKHITGKVTKKVACAVCGCSYEYDITRTVGGSSLKNAVTQADANAQALEDAETKLLAELACPSCGAFTKEMKSYRWKRLGAAFASTGVGIGILLVVLLLMLALHRILVVAAILRVVCVLLGLALFAISLIDLVLPKKDRLA